MTTTTSSLLNIRPNFFYDKVINWFPGHMAKGLRIISEKMSSIDVIVEARDARIPISSINKKFEEVANVKERIIVYNKCDLAEESSQDIITKAFEKYRNQKVLFTNANMDRNIKTIINIAANKARENPQKYPFVTVMVVGMPNVGKSSIINSMRRLGVHRGKAARTGANPGITRAVSNTTIKVLENPTVYLIDTPGVMIPHIPDPVCSLKVALTGGIMDHLSDEEVIADYLLWRLNNFSNFGYVEKFKLPGPTDDVNVLLPAVSKRIGALHKQGEYDIQQAAMFFIKQYRLGKYGRYTLDDVSAEGLKAYFEEEDNPTKEIVLSRNQEKKKKWAAITEKRLERWKKKGFSVKKGKNK